MTTRLTDPCLSRSRSRACACANLTKSHMGFVEVMYQLYGREVTNGEFPWPQIIVKQLAEWHINVSGNQLGEERPSEQLLHYSRRERVEPQGGGGGTPYFKWRRWTKDFLALNFPFRKFLVRKICQVVFGLILIRIIWDIQNYLNLSFCFYVIAETEDVLGCLRCMLLRIFKFWYFIFRVIILCFLENLRLVNSAWDFLRLIFGPGISFLVEGGKGLSEALSIFFGGGFILSPFDHRHPLKFLFLGRPFKNMTVVSLLCSDQFSSNCKLKLFTKPGSIPENK